MNKQRLLIFILLTILFLSCSQEQKQPAVKYAGLDFKEIEKEFTVSLNTKNLNNWLKQDPGTLSVVYFYADWCKVCYSFKPVLLAVLNQEKSNLRTGLVNADHQKQLVASYGITSLPTLKFFKNGQLIYTSVGFLKEQELLQLLGRLHGNKP